MAHEDSHSRGYFNRLNALYESLEDILHPIPKKPYDTWPPEFFYIDPEYAKRLDDVEFGKGKSRHVFRQDSCIYFEKLNRKQRKAVTALLMEYVRAGDNIIVLPPRFCRREQQCPGHYYLEDQKPNLVPENPSHCYIYFFRPEPSRT